jgi:molybdopterin molybdotransferase
MDGYAVKSADTQAAPITLTVVGEVAAGTQPTQRLEQGQAMRIMTGAPLPDGADSVLIIEHTDDPRHPTPPPTVRVYQPVAPGANIRHIGEDVQAGQVFFERGHVLRPQDLGLLAGLGLHHVNVIQRPRVALFSTGDELLTPDQALQAGKIYDMNSYSLSAMVQLLGAQAFPLGIARDSYEQVRAKLHAARADHQAHLILSSAGVSVGARDVVKDVLNEQGRLEFWKVNMRPGKPLAYGMVVDTPFIGLPGNPVSALVTFEVFVRPLILKLAGRAWDVPMTEVTLGEDMQSDGRESYIRVTLKRHNGDWLAFSTGTQSSGALSSLVKADALLVIPAGVTTVKARDKCWVRPFGGAAL